MPIRINLLAEALAEDELRRRDPVKRAIYVGALLVALSLVWFSSTWLEYMIEKNGLSLIQNDISSHTNEYNMVQNDRKKNNEIQKRIDALQKLSNDRFLQGNLLNALQQTYVPYVQLTRLRVDQSYVVSEAVPPKTNSLGVVPGRPAATVEKVVVTFDAKDYSPNSGDQVNRFKDALIRQDYFSSNLDSTNGIRLANLSATQISPEGKPFVLFTVECRFLDKNQ